MKGMLSQVTGTSSVLQGPGDQEPWVMTYENGSWFASFLGV